MDADPAPEREYTIDELAAHTGVPSRTIRFYQAKGALQAPAIRGRKAFYTDAHVERLKLIGDLQDRGLRIRAIRDLVVRLDKGELQIDEWLGLEARLQERWHDEEPVLYDEAELATLLGDRRAGLAADLARLGFLERRGRSWFAPSPQQLRAALQLLDGGIDPSVTRAGVDLVRKNVGRLAEELLALYVKHAGDGFGASDSGTDLGAAFASVRPVALETVQRVFGQEMERVLGELVASGAAAKVARRRR
jgi:DNA-binding transcriptional MerR regulator